MGKGKSGPNQPKQRGRDKNTVYRGPPSLSPLPPQLGTKNQAPPPSSLVWWRGGGGKEKRRGKRRRHTGIGFLGPPPWYIRPTFIFPPLPLDTRAYMQRARMHSRVHTRYAVHVCYYIARCHRIRATYLLQEHKMDRSPPPLLSYLSIIRRAFFLSSGVRTAATAQRTKGPL